MLFQSLDMMSAWNYSDAQLSNHPYINGTFAFPIYILPFGFIVFFGGFIATFGNFMIVIVIWKVNEMRKNKCNILILNLAIADLLSSLNFVSYGTMAILGNLLDSKFLIMTNEKCFYINIVAIWSFNAGSFMILAVGVDRMMATVCPIYYKRLTLRYAFSLTFLSWMFGFINFLLAFISQSGRIIVPACALPTALLGFAHDFWNQSNLLIVILVVITYAVAYKTLRRPQMNIYARETRLYEKNKRLLNSFIIVVFVYVISWAVTMLVIFLVTTFKAKFTVIFHASMYVGILANVNVGCNFYIYYLRSKDYRREFRKIFFGESIRSNTSKKAFGSLLFHKTTTANEKTENGHVTYL